MNTSADASVKTTVEHPLETTVECTKAAFHKSAENNAAYLLAHSKIQCGAPAE